VSGAEYTTIKRPQNGGGAPIVEFICSPSYNCDENNHGTLEGFTITDGTNSGIVISSAHPTIKSCIITGNGGSVYLNGGGIRISSGAPVIEDTTICRNSAAVGGALFITGSPSAIDVTIERCTIEANTAYGNDGGAIGSDSSGGMLSIDETVFSNNRAVGLGGAIMTPPRGAIAGGGFACTTTPGMCEIWWTVSLSNSLFSGNVAARGGALAFDDCTESTIKNTTFSGNTAIGTDSLGNGTGSGGAMWVSNGCTQEIVNSILWGDMSQRGDGMEIVVYLSGDVDISYSVFQEENGIREIGTSGSVTLETGTIFDDPEFCDPYTNDFHLSTGSPAINTGNNNAVDSDYDLDGNDRIYDDEEDVVDMGAYEDQGTGCTGSGVEPVCPCDYANIEDSDPEDGTMDRRQPHPLNDNTLDARQGIGSMNYYTGGPEPITITLDVSDQSSLNCWSLCESGIEPVQEGTAPLQPNRIVSVADYGTGEYQIFLARPISATHWTTITYEPSGDAVSFASDPANCNGDSYVNFADMVCLDDLIDSGTCTSNPAYIWDMDRNGQCNTDDLYRQWDIMNGNGVFYAFFDAIPFGSNTCLAEQEMMGIPELSMYEAVTGGFIDYLMGVPDDDEAAAAWAIEISTAFVEQFVLVFDADDRQRLADELIYAESRCDNESVAEHISKLIEMLSE